MVEASIRGPTEMDEGATLAALVFQEGGDGGSMHTKKHSEWLSSNR